MSFTNTPNFPISLEYKVIPAIQELLTKKSFSFYNLINWQDMTEINQKILKPICDYLDQEGLIYMDEDVFYDRNNLEIIAIKKPSNSAIEIEFKYFERIFKTITKLNQTIEPQDYENALMVWFELDNKSSLKLSTKQNNPSGIVESFQTFLKETFNSKKLLVNHQEIEIKTQDITVAGIDMFNANQGNVRLLINYKDLNIASLTMFIEVQLNKDEIAEILKTSIIAKINFDFPYTNRFEWFKQFPYQKIQEQINQLIKDLNWNEKYLLETVKWGFEIAEFQTSELLSWTDDVRLPLEFKLTNQESIIVNLDFKIDKSANIYHEITDFFNQEHDWGFTTDTQIISVQETLDSEFFKNYFLPHRYYLGQDGEFSVRFSIKAENPYQKLNQETKLLKISTFIKDKLLETPPLNNLLLKLIHIHANPSYLLDKILKTLPSQIQHWTVDNDWHDVYEFFHNQVQAIMNNYNDNWQLDLKNVNQITKLSHGNNEGVLTVTVDTLAKDFNFIIKDVFDSPHSLIEKINLHFKKTLIWPFSTDNNWQDVLAKANAEIETLNPDSFSIEVFLADENYRQNDINLSLDDNDRIIKLGVKIDDQNTWITFDLIVSIGENEHIIAKDIISHFFEQKFDAEANNISQAHNFETAFNQIMKKLFSKNLIPHLKKRLLVKMNPNTKNMQLNKKSSHLIPLFIKIDQEIISEFEGWNSITIKLQNLKPTFTQLAHDINKQIDLTHYNLTNTQTWQNVENEVIKKLKDLKFLRDFQFFTKIEGYKNLQFLPLGDTKFELKIAVGENEYLYKKGKNQVINLTMMLKDVIVDIGKITNYLKAFFAQKYDWHLSTETSEKYTINYAYHQLIENLTFKINLERQPIQLVNLNESINQKLTIDNHQIFLKIKVDQQELNQSFTLQLKNIRKANYEVLETAIRFLQSIPLSAFENITLESTWQVVDDIFKAKLSEISDLYNISLELNLNQNLTNKIESWNYDLNITVTNWQDKLSKDFTYNLELNNLYDAVINKEIKKFFKQQIGISNFTPLKFADLYNKNLWLEPLKKLLVDHLKTKFALNSTRLANITEQLRLSFANKSLFDEQNYQSEIANCQKSLTEIMWKIFFEISDQKIKELVVFQIHIDYSLEEKATAFFAKVAKYFKSLIGYSSETIKKISFQSLNNTVQNVLTNLLDDYLPLTATIYYQEEDNLEIMNLDSNKYLNSNMKIDLNLKIADFSYKIDLNIHTEETNPDAVDMVMQQKFAFISSYNTYAKNSWNTSYRNSMTTRYNYNIAFDTLINTDNPLRFDVNFNQELENYITNESPLVNIGDWLFSSYQLQNSNWLFSDDYPNAWIYFNVPKISYEQYWKVFNSEFINNQIIEINDESTFQDVWNSVNNIATNIDNPDNYFFNFQLVDFDFINVLDLNQKIKESDFRIRVIPYWKHTSTLAPSLPLKIIKKF